MDCAGVFPISTYFVTNSAIKIKIKVNFKLKT